MGAMKILVKRTGALGDVLEATPIVARLRAENPDAIIDIDSQYPQVFFGNPHVSNVCPVSEPYDRVVELNGAFERAMRKLHPIDAYSEVAFGDRKTPHELEFAWEPRVLDKKVVVLHPAISWPIRTLPWKWWQQLIHLLDRAGYRVITTGTLQDHGGFGSATDLRGRITLAEQVGLIDSACCFVCSESGPMIFAQITRAPIIPLLTMVPPEHVIHSRYGKTGWRWHPVRAAVSCVGCAAEQPAETTYFDCRFGHRRCVTEFDAVQVANLVSEVACDIAA